MTRSARDFPLVSAALDDPAIRALFTERFLVATEIYDALVDAACWKLLGDVGALPRPGPGKRETKRIFLLNTPSRPARLSDTWSRSSWTRDFLEG